MEDSHVFVVGSFQVSAAACTTWDVKDVFIFFILTDFSKRDKSRERDKSVSASNLDLPIIEH